MTDSYFFPLLTIPLLAINAMLPHFYKVYLIRAKTGSYDNSNPRALLISEELKQSDDDGRIQRASGAHNNGLEAFPLWAAAVLAAVVSGVSPHRVTVVSAIMLAVRIVYNFLYILITDVRTARLRTLIFAVGYSCSMYLLFSAANEFPKP